MAGLGKAGRADPSVIGRERFYVTKSDTVAEKCVTTVSPPFGDSFGDTVTESRRDLEGEPELILSAGVWSNSYFYYCVCCVRKNAAFRIVLMSRSFAHARYAKRSVLT